MGECSAQAADEILTSKNRTSGANCPNEDSINLSIGDAYAANMSIQALALGIEQRPRFLQILLGVSSVKTSEGIRYRGDPFAITTPIAGRAKGMGRSDG